MANQKRFEHTTEEAKKIALQAVADGKTIRSAMELAGRTFKQWEYWKKHDEGFLRQYHALKASKLIYKKSSSRAEYVGDFPSFSQKYLGSRVFAHQQNVIDVIEGRDPSWLDDAFTYERGLDDYVICNMPPEHAKSMTISVNYATYRIAKDPNIRIILVSKTRELAKQFLYAIKQRLTHPQYIDMQLAFAPEGGFKTDTATWQSERIYLGSELRDSAEKDPTVQALGIGAQIYGSRADLIILDDCVTLSNAHEYEKQIRWIQQEVLTRLGPGSRLLVLGTRVDNIDLYSEIMRPDRYPEGKVPWTVLRMPAVLEFQDDPADWRTLWPKSDQPWSGYDKDTVDADGLYPRWDGKHLATRRGVLDPKTWAMVYQQQDVSEDATFPALLVRRAVNGQRKPGLMKTGASGHTRGMDGLYVVCSMDPAAGGDAGAVAMAVDRQENFRYVLDAKVIPQATPAQVIQVMKDWTDKYQPNEWRVEKNSSQKFLTQSRELLDYLSARGTPLKEHYTGNNKWDLNWGVSSMAPLFGWIDDDDGRAMKAAGARIEFPSTQSHEGMKALIEQLITWAPDTKNKQDMVMALWFACIAAKEQTDRRVLGGSAFAPNQFLSPDRARRRIVVDFNEAFEQANRIVL